MPRAPPGEGPARTGRPRGWRRSRDHRAVRGPARPDAARGRHPVPGSVSAVTSGRWSSAADATRPPAYRAWICAAGQRLAGDLLLEPDDPLEQRLGARRAPGDVDVDRDDRVDALGDAVGVPVGPAGVAAGAERDDVLRLGHLVVEAAYRRRHLVGHRAGHDHEVGLPGTGREGDDAEPDEVVPGHRRGDELDRAAGQPEVEDPEAVAAAPVEDHLDRLGRVLGERTNARSREVDGHVTPSAADRGGPRGPGRRRGR